MGLFDIIKKKTDQKPSQVEYLDDITFIRAMKHIPAAPRHQYDVLLATRGYG